MSVSRRIPKYIRLAAAIIAVCVLAGVTTGQVLAAGQDAAPAGRTVGQLAQDGQGDEGGEGQHDFISECASCHPDVTTSWQGGPHDLAFTVPHFQEGWGKVDNDPACLDCHTTGFSPVTGEYDAEGVTCEACHGDIPEGHPPAPVDLSRANAVCAECHTVTQAEFRASHHAEVGMECTSCHYAHTNGLRMETELQQCLNCHGDELGGFVAHTTHIENGLSCRDCHGYVTPGHPIPDDGLAPTGHDFQASIRACLDCHEDIRLEPTNGEVGATAAEPTTNLEGQQAQLRAAQLEAAVQTLLHQRQNTRTMNLVEGAAGGALLGGVAVFLLARRRNGNDHDKPADEK